MSRGLEPHLRVVGGNSAVTHIRLSSADARWPPIKVAASDGVLVDRYREPKIGNCPIVAKCSMWNRIAAVGWNFFVRGPVLMPNAPTRADSPATCDLGPLRRVFGRARRLHNAK